MWINAPTNVMMNTNTIESASMRRLTETDNFSMLIQCQSVCAYASRGGGVCIKLRPRIIATTAAALTLPAPMKAIAFLESLFPASERIRKPTKGNAGINASRLFMYEMLDSVKISKLNVLRRSPSDNEHYHTPFGAGGLIFQFPQLFHIQRLMLVESLEYQGKSNGDLCRCHR